MAAALGARLNVLATAGNFNNEIGLPMTLFGLDETHECAVLEMAMRGNGQIKYLAEIATPTVGVVTNIGPQHIELLGSLDNIARAKAELIEALPADGVAVLPADDEYSQFLVQRAPCRVVTFGQSEDADYRVTSIAGTEEGFIRFALAAHGARRVI
jgi:UDP-N-acetylmuramoyl-tripeptide--D-alanyl-D-alanine ligase